MLENNKPLVNQITKVNLHDNSAHRNINKASTESVDKVVQNFCLNTAHADSA